ncbi:hypothetical protein [Pantoea sp. AS-PWVM4]|uniref:hypothetical protein n=1 Tax=Pantoea sp. AS-PWVM4 TaxID=1332069 RepID=UPI0012690BAF|nr:hypothetical protein [Pantoea sp. AS-PWVM4]
MQNDFFLFISQLTHFLSFKVSSRMQKVICHMPEISSIGGRVKIVYGPFLINKGWLLYAKGFPSYALNTSRILWPFEVQTQCTQTGYLPGQKVICRMQKVSRHMPVTRNDANALTSCFLPYDA